MTTPVNPLKQPLKDKLVQQLSTIYDDVPLEESFDDIAQSLLDIMELSSKEITAKPFSNHWSEQDVILITYGDSIIEADQAPLKTLKSFLDSTIGDTINSVHILPSPFFLSFFFLPSFLVLSPLLPLFFNKIILLHRRLRLLFTECGLD